MHGKDQITILTLSSPTVIDSEKVENDEALADPTRFLNLFDYSGDPILICMQLGGNGGQSTKRTLGLVLRACYMHSI